MFKYECIEFIIWRHLMGYINVPNITIHKRTHSYARFMQPDQVTRDRMWMRTQRSTFAVIFCFLLALQSLAGPNTHTHTHTPYQLTIMENMHFHLAKNLHEKYNGKLSTRSTTTQSFLGNCLKILLFHHFVFLTVLFRRGCYYTIRNNLFILYSWREIYDCLTICF